MRPEAAAAAALAGLDRRGFLRLAGATLALALPASGCREAPRGVRLPAGLELQHLTPRTWAVLGAAAARIAGPRGAALVAQRVIDPGAAAERFLAGAPELAAPLRQALLVLEFGVPPLRAQLKPFTSLGGPGQDAVLAALAASRLAVARRLFAGVRSVALLGFYGALGEARPAGYEIGVIPA